MSIRSATLTSNRDTRTQTHSTSPTFTFLPILFRPSVPSRHHRITCTSLHPQTTQPRQPSYCSPTKPSYCRCHVNIIITTHSHQLLPTQRPSKLPTYLGDGHRPHLLHHRRHLPLRPLLPLALRSQVPRARIHAVERVAQQVEEEG